MMIEVTRPSTPELFASYDDLFKHLNQLENLKMLAPNPDFRDMDWSFALYTPDRVKLLLAHKKEVSLPIREACEQGLPVLEICTGDFAKPQYVVLTPSLKLGYLKRKWALAYCESHDLTVRARE